MCSGPLAVLSCLRRARTRSGPPAIRSAARSAIAPNAVGIIRNAVGIIR
jgi:hypothetical protein